MKKWVRNTVNIFALGCSLIIQAQDIPIGTWRTHFSYQSARLLTQGSNSLFCATANGLYIYDPSNDISKIISKVDGLSDASVTTMAFDVKTETLVLGYASGLVDLVNPQGIHTVRDLNETDLVGSKNINDAICNAGYAYLATGLGVVVIDLTSKDIYENYRALGPGGADIVATNISLINSTLYINSDFGILSGNTDSNLLDFNNWTAYPETAGQNSSHFILFQNAVYAINEQTDLIKLENDTWSQQQLGLSENINALSSDGTNLVFLTDQNLYQYDGNSYQSINAGISFSKGSDFVLMDQYWIADRDMGLVNLAGKTIVPNGPLTDLMDHIRYTNQNIYAFYTPKPTIPLSNDSYEVFDNQTWKSESLPGFYQISDVATYNNQMYFSSGYGGLWNNTNQSLLEEFDSIQISYMTASDRLFLVSSNDLYPLITLNNQNEMDAYTSADIGLVRPTSVELSSRNVLWFETTNSGVAVTNLESSESKTIGTNAGLPATETNDILLDDNDDAWIATNAGLFLFQNASSPFGNTDVYKPAYENRILLENESILTLAKDGGNRIWISHENGIWVFDDNITELIYEFTTANSPLPSHVVKEMAYHPGNGEMYILTDKGIVSFRSNSSAGRGNYNDVRIFPNPVRPGYDGLVGISGLVTNATIKITDIHGRLISSLQANGGTASWDLRSFNNEKVATGVYLFFSTNADGSKTFVGKIAVIN